MKIDFSTPFRMKYKISADPDAQPFGGEPLLPMIGDDYRAVEIRCRWRQELGSECAKNVPKTRKAPIRRSGLFRKTLINQRLFGCGDRI
ncbi:hypothetical protein [Oceanibaculum pacificum]|uniref:hypothetical protein n=1 Tax=Oceanibaculum pacificum TaxID=580166 RepID=UPI0012ECE0B6|nr:hypothetical protein [Oceanibaculum pacificum]